MMQSEGKHKLSYTYLDNNTFDVLKENDLVIIKFYW